MRYTVAELARWCMAAHLSSATDPAGTSGGRGLYIGNLAVAAGGSDDPAGYALRMLRTAGLPGSGRRAGVLYLFADGFPGRLPGKCMLALGTPTPHDRGGGWAR